ncbi:MAG TPA: hypothetical protein GXX75_19365 [Clostridiales bacterium]|nr:hypothetical protein [Clostridiales bacterium]
MKGFFKLVISLILIFIIYIIFENNMLVVKEYNISSSNISNHIDGYKIGLITDFHNSSNYSKIIKKMRIGKPDLIALVGDTINMGDKECKNAENLVDGLTEIAPVYLVSGNHEIAPMAKDITAEFYNYAKNRGVNIIDNQVVEIEYNHGIFNLIGFGDIIYDDENLREPVFYNRLKENLQGLYDKIPDKSLFNVLLFHRGNYIDTISEYDFDLVLAGHMHGGQINLPFLKDKLLEYRYGSSKFSGGYYKAGNLKAIISRGAPYNLKEPRLFNPPEIDIITLMSLTD